MLSVSVGQGGMRVEGTGGRRYPHHHTRECLRPQVDVRFLSDKAHSRERWLPFQKSLPVRIDTGADVSSLSSRWMLQLGLREEESDRKVVTTAADGKQVFARQKSVCMKIEGFEEKVLIPINYSRDFREDLIVLSLAALTPFYGVVLTDQFTVLYSW